MVAGILKQKSAEHLQPFALLQQERLDTTLAK
jgi:hypothetical protein